MNYKYSHSLCSEIEIDISFYQFYRRFSIHYLLFCFFFPSKIFYASPKGSILYKTKDNISFFFLRALTFYFLINLFIAIQFDYFILNVITFLFDSRPAFCFISLFNKMIYPSTKASNLFLLPLRFCLLNIF